MNRFALAAAALLFLLAACSRLTVENYNKLKTGMSYEEVKALLGDPARCDEILGIRACSWGDERRRINVSFMGGKVMLFTAENIK